MNELSAIDFKRLFLRLQELFALRDFGKPLLTHGGRMCVNVRLDCLAGSFFLKQYRQYLTNYVHEVKYAEAFFAERGVPVILPLEDKHGRHAFWFDHHWYSLFPWVEGSSPRTPLSEPMVSSLGKELARLHTFGRGAADRSMHPLHLWDPRRFHAQYAALVDAFERKAHKESRDHLARELVEKKRVFVQKNRFAPGDVTLAFCDLLHGDFIHSNVFMDIQGHVTHVYDFEKACRGPQAFEVVRSLMINCFDDGWGEEQERNARLFLGAYQTGAPLDVDAFAQAMRVYMVRLAHMGWLEAQVLLMGSTAFDPVLQAHLTRLTHADTHLEEWSRALLS